MKVYSRQHPIIAGWWKGKHFSRIHRERIGKANTGKQRSPEVCARLSKAFKGRKLAKEHRDNIGKGVRQHLQKYGYQMSTTGREAIRKAAKKRRGVASWNKGKTLKPHQNPWNKSSYRKKMCALRRAEWRSESVRKRQSIARKKMWTRQEYRETHKKRIQQFVGSWPSKIQTKIWHLFRPLGFKLEHFCAGYSLDIAHPERKIDIEVDGALFHTKAKDRIRDNRLKKLGWTIIRINSRQMYDKEYLTDLKSKLKERDRG